MGINASFTSSSMTNCRKKNCDCASQPQGNRTTAAQFLQSHTHTTACKLVITFGSAS